MTHSLAESLGGGSPFIWAHDWLVEAQFPTTPENVRAVVSWEYAESGGGGGMWNPLNTTQGGFAGETDLNSVGVKNYVQRSDGLEANAHVIHNGLYPIVVAQLGFGVSAQAIVDAIVASPWGTKHIQLIPPIVPPPAPTPTGDSMLYLTPGKPDPNKFSGAVVVTGVTEFAVTGDTLCTPDPSVLASNANGIIGSYAGPAPHTFTVVKSDKDEYHFTLTMR